MKNVSELQREKQLFSQTVVLTQDKLFGIVFLFERILFGAVKGRQPTQHNHFFLKNLNQIFYNVISIMGGKDRKRYKAIKWCFNGKRNRAPAAYTSSTLPTLGHPFGLENLFTFSLEPGCQKLTSWGTYIQ